MAKDTVTSFRIKASTNTAHRDEVTWLIEQAIGGIMETIQALFGEESILHNWGIQVETEVVCQRCRAAAKMVTETTLIPVNACFKRGVCSSEYKDVTEQGARMALNPSESFPHKMDCSGIIFNAEYLHKPRECFIVMGKSKHLIVKGEIPIRLQAGAQWYQLRSYVLRKSPRMEDPLPIELQTYLVHFDNTQAVWVRKMTLGPKEETQRATPFY